MDFAAADFAALLQVILIDLALAGDNAVAVGLAAAALPAAQRKQVIIWGVALALVLRIVFALVTVQLLEFRGILLLGGLLLMWVAYRMWIDLKHHHAPAPVFDPETGAHAGEVAGKIGGKPATFGRALMTIVIADVSMSLDNVLAVAGVSRHNPAIMAFGLVLSVVLMAVAANFIAKIIGQHRWVAYVGIAIIVIAGVQMIWEDLHDFFPETIPELPKLAGAH